MPNSWSKIREEWEKEKQLLRRRIKITLYGSYLPKREIKFLYSLKQFLINNDYTQTKIVKEYEIDMPGLTPSELSRWSLGYSDANFFIVTKTGNNKGIIRELAFLDDDPSLVYKQAFTTIFEEKNKYSQLSQLSLDDIKSLDIVMRDYSTTKMLEKRILIEASSYVRKLKAKLKMVGP